MTIPFLSCMAAAAMFYHLPPRVLPSIQAVEHGAVGMIHMNANATADLGVMQINSIWIVPLARYTALSQSDITNRLINDACFNIAAAAAIMRVYLNEAQGDLMTAIGYYHSHTPALGTVYQQKVLAQAAQLFRPQRSPSASH
jgi:Transglycosylase SLT domain